jgi:hypothetical protein
MEELRVDSLRAIERDPNALNRYNLVSLLSIPGLGVPAFHSGFPGYPGQGPQAPLPSISAATAAAALCLLCGSLLSALYYGMLGQAVRDGRTTPTSFAPDFAPILAWTVALFVLIVVLVGAVFIPFGMLLAATHAAPALTALLVPLFAGFVLWILIYLVFTSAAVYVNRVPPLVAVRQSIQVVRSNFWSTLGLILLIVLIGSGLQTLWEELAVNLPGIGAAAAIVGHIYIASGLSAASMIYYKERFERLAVA